MEKIPFVDAVIPSKVLCTSIEAKFAENILDYFHLVNFLYLLPYILRVMGCICLDFVQTNLVSMKREIFVLNVFSVG